MTPLTKLFYFTTAISAYTRYAVLTHATEIQFLRLFSLLLFDLFSRYKISDSLLGCFNYYY